MEEDPSVAARLARLQAEYGQQGMRRSVEAVLVVHDHGHAHILMMQIANTFFKLYVWTFSAALSGMKRRQSCSRCLDTT